MDINSGEPLPPGFEDEMNRLPDIQPIIDQNKTDALIGLEYTVELHEEDCMKCTYLCVLCNKRGDSNSIIKHWTSFNHRLKYLDKHYPSVIKKCSNNKSMGNSHSTMVTIVQALAEAIDRHYGRLILTVKDADMFRRKRTVYIEMIMRKHHFCERTGPNFHNVLDQVLGENHFNKRKFDDSSKQLTVKLAKSSNDICITSEKMNRNCSNKDDLDEVSSDTDNGEQICKSHVTNKQQSPNLSNRSNQLSRRIPTPKELSLQASHIAQKRYKWEKYNCMLQIQLKQMMKIQQEYDINPEKHPLYPEEWKKFWNRRYKELQAEKGIDPNTYDYKPEWIIFWTTRSKDLYEAEIEKKKKEIKLKVGLPENAVEEKEIKEHTKSASMNYNIYNNDKSLDSAKIGKICSDIINISDDESSSFTQLSSLERSHNRSRPHSRLDSPSNSSLRCRSSRTEFFHEMQSKSKSRSLSPFSDDYENDIKQYKLYRQRLISHRNYKTKETEADYFAYNDSHKTYLSQNDSNYRTIDHQKSKYTASKKITKNNSNTDGKEQFNHEEDENGPLTIIAVLRLLTALEDQLGSLGPKVVNLLSQALTLEKNEANSSEDMLQIEEHCVFLETIKEKLKGILIAEVVDDQQKLRVIKRAVKNIAALIHQVTSKGLRNECRKGFLIKSGTTKANDLPTSLTTTKEANVFLPISWDIVGPRLMAALAREGYDNIPNDNMEKLIHLFALLVKISTMLSDFVEEPFSIKNILNELDISGIRKNSCGNDTNSSLPAIVDELFERELSTLVQEVVDEIEGTLTETDTRNESNINTMASLTDSDLQTLLQNFKHLANDEQHNLIAHLKKLESADPERVEKLRKYVNFSEMDETSDNNQSSKFKDKSSSLSSKNCNDGDGDHSRNSICKKKNTETPSKLDCKSVNSKKFTLDDEDDDDYNFDEVVKAASNNVKRLSDEHHASKYSDDSRISEISSSKEINISLKDTENVIAKLMGSLQKSNCNSGILMNSSTATKSDKLQSQEKHPDIEKKIVSDSGSDDHQLLSNMPYYQQASTYLPNGNYNQMNTQHNMDYSMMFGYNQLNYNNFQQWNAPPSGSHNGFQLMPNNTSTYGTMPTQQSSQIGYNMGYHTGT